MTNKSDKGLRMKKLLNKLMRKLGFIKLNTHNDIVAGYNQSLTKAHDRNAELSAKYNGKIHELRSLENTNQILRRENANVVATVQPMIRGAETITHEGDGFNIVVTIADGHMSTKTLENAAAKATTILDSRRRLIDESHHDRLGND